MFVQDNVLAYCFYNSMYLHQNALAYCLVQQCFRATKYLSLFYNNLFVHQNILVQNRLTCSGARTHFCFYNSMLVHQDALAYCLVQQCFRAPKCLSLFYSNVFVHQNAALAPYSLKQCIAFCFSQSKVFVQQNPISYCFYNKVSLHHSVLAYEF